MSYYEVKSVVFDKKKWEDLCYGGRFKLPSIVLRQKRICFRNFRLQRKMQAVLGKCIGRKYAVS